MLLMLRRNGSGLESLRNIRTKLDELRAISTITNDSTDLSRFKDKIDVLCWGYVRSLPNNIGNIMNSPRAVAYSSNKGVFRKALYENNLTMETYNDVNLVPEDAFNNGVKWVIRPNNHFGGNHMYVVTSKEEMISSLRLPGLSNNNYYVSKFIDKTNEYRVMVMNGRVLYVVEKIVDDKTAHAWNVHQGGSFVNVSYGKWNLKVVKHALIAMKLTSLDFGAVDVMIDSNGVPYVLEVNTSPAMTSDYWSTCFAKGLVYNFNKETIEDIKVDIDIDDAPNWKYLIHPAVSTEAVVPSISNDDDDDDYDDCDSDYYDDDDDDDDDW